MIRVFALILAAGLAFDPAGAAGETAPLPASRPDRSGADAANNLEPDRNATVPRIKPDLTPPASAETAAERERRKPAPEKTPVQPKPVFDLAGAKKCEQDLRRLNARFTVAKPLNGDAQCGWPRPLKLTALSRDVNISGDIQVRCELALALARWSKQVVVPSAELHLGVKPTAVEISTSYQCRRRNNGTVGKLSEHAFANGIDVMAVRLGSERRVAVADRRGSSDAERAFQAAIRGGACAFFTTVLGPVTNANHRDHFHFDLAVRRGGYRLCQ
jgi:hypothetical protein